MGHVRLGRIPKTRGWRDVIRLLSDPHSTASHVAAATAVAAEDYLTRNRTDAALVFSYWLLTQITFKARSDDFVAELREIGLDVGDARGALDFLARVARFAHAQIRSRGETFPLFEFAQLSLREVLTETIGQQCQSLFGTSLEDIRFACRRYSAPERFAALARLYFAKFLNRTLSFFISKESLNSVGSGQKFQDLSELSRFNAAVEGYCYQSAKIVEQFAGGWYSERNWQGGISETDAKAFTAVAIGKLAGEIARERETEEPGKR